MNRSISDNKIKESLHNHTSDVDVDGLWAAIEPSVDAINASNKKKRRGVFWWLFAGLLVTGGLGAFLLSEFGKENRKPSENLEIVVESWKNQEQSHETAIQSAVDNNRKTDSKRIESKSRQNENELKVQENKSENTDATQLLLNKEEYKKLQSFLGINDEPKAEIKHTPDSQIAVPDKSQVLLFIQNLNQLDLKSVKRTEDPWPVPRDYNQKLAERLTMHAHNLTDEDLGIKKEPYSSYGRDKMRISAAFQSSISLTDRKLEAKEAQYLNLLSLRESSERNLETVQLGLRLNLHLKSGLEFGSGINFTQINERFDYRNSTTTIDSINGIQAYSITLEGDTIPVYGPVPHIVDTLIRKKYFNKYQLLEVPVLVGFRFKAQKTIFGIQAGTFINLSMTPKGRILETETGDIDINNSNIFKTNIGLSYYLGVSIEHPFNDNISAYVSPFMRYFPNDFTNSDYGLRQKYALYGIDVGVRYLFD